MKRFTLKDIKEFCKTYYGWYLKERDLIIAFEFITEDYVRRISFSNMVVNEPYFHGVWAYDGCTTPDCNVHVFKFKRTA